MILTPEINMKYVMKTCSNVQGNHFKQIFKNCVINMGEVFET